MFEALCPLHCRQRRGLRHTPQTRTIRGGLRFGQNPISCRNLDQRLVEILVGLFLGSAGSTSRVCFVPSRPRPKSAPSWRMPWTSLTQTSCFLCSVLWSCAMDCLAPRGEAKSRIDHGVEEDTVGVLGRPKLRRSPMA